MAKFIWGGGRDNNSIHLTRWEIIAIPKYMGGWGILDLDVFGNALIIKSLWRCLHCKGIWHEITKQKYLGRESVEDLDIMGWKESNNRSYIWKGFGKAWPLNKENLRWHFWIGFKILIGCCNEGRKFTKFEWGYYSCFKPKKKILPTWDHIGMGFRGTQMEIFLKSGFG